MTAVQLGTVAVLAAFLSLALRTPWAAGFFAATAEAHPVPWERSFVTSVLYLATIGTVGTFFGQTWAQRQMSATHAAILFALEPVFAALLAAPFLGERLGPRGLAGGALVLGGIVVSELRLRRTGRESARRGVPQNETPKARPLYRNNTSAGVSRRANRTVSHDHSMVRREPAGLARRLLLTGRDRHYGSNVKGEGDGHE